MSNRTFAIAAGSGVFLIFAAVFITIAVEPPSPTSAVRTPAPEPEPAMPNIDPVPPAEQPAPADPEPAEPADPAAEERASAEVRARIEARPERMGPVDKLKAAYESDPRDPDAGATEALIRKQLEQPEIPVGMLRRVSCVKTVCKLELRWTSDDRQAYMIAMMSLVNHVSQELAAEPVGQDDGQLTLPIDVYVSRIVPSFEATRPGAPVRRRALRAATHVRELAESRRVPPMERWHKRCCSYPRTSTTSGENHEIRHHQLRILRGRSRRMRERPGRAGARRPNGGHRCSRRS
jgi:hypothetical protein